MTANRITRIYLPPYLSQLLCVGVAIKEATCQDSNVYTPMKNETKFYGFQQFCSLTLNGTDSEVTWCGFRCDCMLKPMSCYYRDPPEDSSGG